METTETIYRKALDYLNRFEAQKDALVNCLKEMAEAEANYSSIRAMVSKEHDNDEKISKTALNNMIDGDKRVVDAKDRKFLLKSRKEGIKAVMTYLEMGYSLEKKRMDSLNHDKKYLGTN